MQSNFKAKMNSDLEKLFGQNCYKMQSMIERDQQNQVETPSHLSNTMQENEADDTVTIKMEETDQKNIDI
jgi:translation initiation factor IF-1